MSAIWQRATKVASQFKKLKEGRQQCEYLQIKLKLELQHGDLTRKEKSIQKDLTTANKENEHLQTEVLKVKEASNKLAAEVKVLPEHVRFKRALLLVVTVPPPLSPTHSPQLRQ